jgi:hypothetical protein
MQLQRVLLALPAILLLSACAQKPDGKVDVQKMVADQSGGAIQVVWYQKTGDVDLTAPKEGDEVDYVVQVVIVDDVFWTGPSNGKWSGKFCAKRTASLPKDATGEPVSPGPDYVSATKNTYIRLSGHLTYESTPNGLQPIFPHC